MYMSDDILQINSMQKRYALPDKFISKSLLRLDLNLNGYNEDLTEKYFWHLNFAYFTGKGYTALKLEDYHYFSENSQFGTQMRQVKGGSIRAFQENFQQLLQLIRSHLLPLLKEVKAAEMYKQWFDQIVDNDKKYQEMRKRGVSESNEELRKVKSARDEALNHMKDKWVNEIDGGRLWQMNRSSTEQGLDFALLPQLFFGTNLVEPLNTMKLKEQLDSDIYSIDISLGAKEQVARFMYRFYTWLPTGISDTNVTFKLKISALRNIYAQIQMYINFMKPLLIEITRKSEGLEKANLYASFEMDNPDFVNMFDFSYSFVKILGIRDFMTPRGSHTIKDLEFTKYGLFIDGRDIFSGKFKGKSGFLVGTEGKSHKDVKYIFYPCENADITDLEFEKLQDKWLKDKTYIDKVDLKPYPCMTFDFSQKRRNELKETQQGPQQVPFMKNLIDYTGFSWNIYEIASYRESLKVDNLKLLETFVDELKVVRDDLLKYINYFPTKDFESLRNVQSQAYSSESESKKSSSEDFSLILSPFQALGDMVSMLLPDLDLSGLKKKHHKEEDEERDDHHKIVRVSIAEDVWKVYTVFKKSHLLIQY